MKRILVILTSVTLAFGAAAQPIIVANGPFEMCAGDSITMCVDPPYASYLWSNGDTSQCITAGVSGDYWVIVADSEGTIDSTSFYSPFGITIHDPQPVVDYFPGFNTLTCSNGQPTWEYQWYLNGVAIPGATAIAYDPVQSGNYYLEVADEFGCTGHSMTIEISNISVNPGIEESAFSELRILNGPSSDNVQLDFGEVVRDVNVSVFNPLGALLYSTAANGQYADVVMPNATGVYFIRLLAPDGRKRTLKVVRE